MLFSPPEGSWSQEQVLIERPFNSIQAQLITCHSYVFTIDLLFLRAPPHLPNLPESNRNIKHLVYIEHYKDVKQDKHRPFSSPLLKLRPWKDDFCFQVVGTAGSALHPCSPLGTSKRTGRYLQGESLRLSGGPGRFTAAP